MYLVSNLAVQYYRTRKFIMQAKVYMCLRSNLCWKAVTYGEGAAVPSPLSRTLLKTICEIYETWQNFQDQVR